MFCINGLSPLHLEADIIILPVLKLKKLHLRTATGHTLSQQGQQVSKPGLSDSEGRAGNHRPPGLLPGWPVSRPESFRLLSGIPWGAWRQTFLCFRACAADHCDKPHCDIPPFPWENAPVFPWGPFCALGLCPRPTRMLSANPPLPWTSPQ